MIDAEKYAKRKISPTSMKTEKNNLISESDLRTILDNLSRKYSINVIIENREEKMPMHIGYKIDKNAIIVNIPLFLDLINQRTFSKFSEIENFIGAKFLHEFHHSKIRREKTDLGKLLNFCEDYYIEKFLMKDNDVIKKDDMIFRDECSKMIEDDKLNIIFVDLERIYLLCSIYDKEELKNIYGDGIINYKNIFENIKCENDIGNAVSELKKLYENDTKDIIHI